MQGEGYCRRICEHVIILHLLSPFRAIVPFALGLVTCHLPCPLEPSIGELYFKWVAFHLWEEVIDFGGS